MISTRNLKRHTFRSDKFFPLEKVTKLLDSIIGQVEILSDETGRTSNLTRIDGKLPAPLLVKPESVRLVGSTQIGCEPDLKKATAKALLPVIGLLKPVADACGATILFNRSYAGPAGQPVVEVAVRHRNNQVSLELGFSSRHETGRIDAEALRAVFAFFEKLLNAPGKFATFVEQTLAANQPKVALRKSSTFAGEKFEELVSMLLDDTGPAGFKTDACRLFVHDSDVWDSQAFNRGVELVNSHAPLFKEAVINYFWQLKRHEDYALLADYYQTIDDQELDTCLFSFKLPSGAEGILLLTYGKKGYRVFVSFDDGAAIEALEAFSKVRFSRF